jgi:hypothetical protein
LRTVSRLQRHCDGCRARPRSGLKKVKTHPSRSTGHEPGINAGAAQFRQSAIAERVVTDDTSEAHLVPERGQRGSDIGLRSACNDIQAARLHQQLPIRRGQAQQDFAEAGDTHR